MKAFFIGNPYVYTNMSANTCTSHSCTDVKCDEFSCASHICKNFAVTDVTDSDDDW